MDNHGAFVELDQHKLTRDQLVLLGMKEAHDMWIDTLSSQVEMAADPILRAAVVEIKTRMTDIRDKLAVVLTKAAVKSGSGSLHNIKAEI